MKLFSNIEMKEYIWQIWPKVWVCAKIRFIVSNIMKYQRNTTELGAESQNVRLCCKKSRFIQLLQQKVRPFVIWMLRLDSIKKIIIQRYDWNTRGTFFHIFYVLFVISSLMLAQTMSGPEIHPFTGEKLFLWF